MKSKLYKAAWVIIISFCWVYASSSNDEFIARQAEQCFGKPVSLQCDAGESVRVLDAFYRQREHCPGHVISNYCTKLETSNPVCVGNRTCTFNAPWLHISSECGFSNNFLVTYQCIPAKLMHNVCGSRAVFRAKRGFLVSPSYPGRYPAPSHCLVRIVASPGEIITIHVVDIHLAHYNYDVTHECIDRVWFEETGEQGKGKQGQQTGSKGAPLCTRQQRSLVFESRGSEVTVHFTTADHVFNNIRGFWLYYKMGPAASSSGTTVAAAALGQLTSSLSSTMNASVVLEAEPQNGLSSTPAMTAVDDVKWQTNAMPVDSLLHTEELTVDKDIRQTLDSSDTVSSMLSDQASTAAAVTMATTPTPAPGMDVDKLKSLYKLIGHYYPTVINSVAAPKALLSGNSPTTVSSSDNPRTHQDNRPTSYYGLHFDGSGVAATELPSGNSGQEQRQGLMADKQSSMPVVAITVGGCISLIVLVVIVCAILFYNRRCFAGSDKVAHKGQRDVILAFDGDKSDSRQMVAKQLEDDRKLTDRNNTLAYSVRLSTSAPTAPILAVSRLTDATAAAAMQKAAATSTMYTADGNNTMPHHAAFNNYSLRAIDEAAEDAYMSAKRREARVTSDYFSSSTRRSASMKNNTFRSQRATKSMPRQNHHHGNGGGGGVSVATMRSNSLRLPSSQSLKAQSQTSKSSTASTFGRPVTYQASVQGNSAFVSTTSSDSCHSSNEETAALKKTRTPSAAKDISPLGPGHRRSSSFNKRHQAGGVGGGGGREGRGRGGGGGGGGRGGEGNVNYSDVRKSSSTVRSSVRFMQPAEGTGSHQLLHYHQQQKQQQHSRDTKASSLSPTSSNDNSYESLFSNGNSKLTTCHERL